MGPILHVPGPYPNDVSRYVLPGTPGAAGGAPAPSGPGFLGVMRQSRAIIIVCVVIALVIGTIYLFTATPLYSAVAEISVVKGGAPGVEGAAAPVSDNYLYTQREIIRSTPVLALALREANADTFKTFKGMTNRIGWLKRELDVDVGKGDQIVTVALEGPDGGEAQQLVAAIIDCYQKTQNDQEQRAIDEKIRLYKPEKVKTDLELSTVQKQLDDLRGMQSETTLMTQGPTFQMQQAGALSSALVTAQLDTVQEKTAFIQSARSAGGLVGKAAANPDWDPDLATERVNAAASPAPMDPDAAHAEELQLRQQLALLKQHYMPGYAAIQATQDRLNDVDAAIVNSARVRWLSAVDKETGLQKAFDELQKVASKQGTAAAEYTRLQADASRLQERADSLDKTIRDLSYSVQAASVTISPIEPAEVQDGVAAPKMIKVYPVALAAGLAAGMGLGLMRHGSGRGRPAKAAKRSDGRSVVLGMPVLAALPRVADAPLKIVAWSGHLRPDSPLAQMFRTLQQTMEKPPEPGELAEGQADLSGARTIMLASAVAGEGRTTAACNLAIALARGGKRVCLVDGDFRMPVLAKIFQSREDTGFSNVLAGVETLTKAVQQTVIDRLDLLPSGLTPRDPAALLNSDRLGETLEDLTLSYDVVVVDSPPVLASPDARILAASCDATLLVAASDSASRRFAEQGRDSLLAVGAQIAGIITNQPPRRGSRDGGDSGRGEKPSVSVETHAPPAVGMREKRGA